MWFELQPQAFLSELLVPELLCSPGACQSQPCASPVPSAGQATPPLTPAGLGWFTAGLGTSVSHLVGRN